MTSSSSPSSSLPPSPLVAPPSPPPPPPPKDFNQYRTPPLRYLGYANELGETAKPLLPPTLKYLYHASYAVAFTYVLADSDRCVELKEEGKDGKVVFADAVVWQTAASVVIPGFFINRIVSLTNEAAKKGGVRGKMWGSAAGLASIPFIIQPIDTGVDWVMDTTFRKWF